ncbi:MAG: molybdopterin molybdotransferase MoeA [Rhodobacterales bacterium]|nr:molybdopterin molybdotransferase MoeA [Rhodobacterales bacterium]
MTLSSIKTVPVDITSCGCDDPTLAAKLIPVNVALMRGLELAIAVDETEIVPLERALGRVLAEPATTPQPLPSFDNSAMDGYAVRLDDLSGEGPWQLPVFGRIAAGDAGDLVAPKGQVLRILTGAPVPADIDAVIMQEHVTRAHDSITITKRPALGLNIRRLGEDLAEGAEILPAGVEIGSREACALAAIGAGEVAVKRKLKVAIFCTGSELVAPGAALAPGQIWNSNRFMLLSALDKPWIELRDLGTVPDQPDDLIATLKDAAAGADMVISTGGVSVGDEDHMPRLFREAGGNIHAMRVAMKPGKPVAIGKMNGALYVGLPGNPVSAFVTWHIIGAQILAKRAGLSKTEVTTDIVSAGFDVTRRPGRKEYRPAQIVGRDANGIEIVEVMSPSYSARVALLSAADGLVLIPAEATEASRGEALDFIRFS